MKLSAESSTANGTLVRQVHMLYCNSCNKVRVKTVNSLGLALLMGLIAELQCSVNAVILEVVNFLKDSVKVLRAR